LPESFAQILKKPSPAALMTNFWLAASLKRSGAGFRPSPDPHASYKSNN
jgi:hypothetical protein